MRKSRFYTTVSMFFALGLMEVETFGDTSGNPNQGVVQNCPKEDVETIAQKLTTAHNIDTTKTERYNQYLEIANDGCVNIEQRMHAVDGAIEVAKSFDECKTAMDISLKIDQNAFLRKVKLVLKNYKKNNGSQSSQELNTPQIQEIQNDKKSITYAISNPNHNSVFSLNNDDKTKFTGYLLEIAEDKKYDKGFRKKIAALVEKYGTEEQKKEAKPIAHMIWHRIKSLFGFKE